MAFMCHRKLKFSPTQIALSHSLLQCYQIVMQRFYPVHLTSRYCLFYIHQSGYVIDVILCHYSALMSSINSSQSGFIFDSGRINRSEIWLQLGSPQTKSSPSKQQQSRCTAYSRHLGGRRRGGTVIRSTESATAFPS